MNNVWVLYQWLCTKCWNANKFQRFLIYIFDLWKTSQIVSYNVYQNSRNFSRWCFGIFVWLCSKTFRPVPIDPRIWSVYAKGVLLPCRCRRRNPTHVRRTDRFPSETTFWGILPNLWCPWPSNRRTLRACRSPTPELWTSNFCSFRNPIPPYRVPNTDLRSN